MTCGDTCTITMKPENFFIIRGFQMQRVELCAQEPGQFQVHFVVVGDCSSLVEVRRQTTLHLIEEAQSSTPLLEQFS